ncbi:MULTISPECIES: hypothetical protein [Gammaproteobacteria]|uniref:hypothetical protein n=1 Tax=Gammaproteobacteria TaxID=1236 RepID=UPI0018CEAB13|nr:MULTISPECIES: hypothetical protein [Gammaproteobacteria]MBH0033052.1 hypothetical protein [Pseudoalteromonas sp. SWYJZ98]
MAALIHAATSKATPVDADELGIVDSAASNVLKKLTFANLAAWVRGIALTGLSTATNAVITAADTVLVALGKLQAQVNELDTKKLDNTGGDIAGNVNFSGTGRRITADFSNATVASRAMFQTSTTNGATVLGAMPSGAGGYSEYSLYNGPDPTNAAKFDFSISGSTARLRSTAIGTGASLPINIETPGGTTLHLGTNGDVLALRGALGYGTGAGGTVTQATSKTTGVTLNKPNGQITMNSSALSAGAAVVFSVSNSYALSTSLIDVCGGYNSGAPDPSNYRIELNWSGNGVFSVRVTNISTGTLSEELVINFQLRTGSTS